MSRTLQDIHRRKYKKRLPKIHDFLSRCEDSAFLQLLWAVGQLQQPHPANVSRVLNYPKEAAISDMESPYFAYKWNLETLALLCLSTKKKDQGPYYDCTQFQTLANAVNALRGVEDYEFAALPRNSDILVEMHRIGHQQFGWQRGFATSERFYRFSYIYGQGTAGQYFQDTYGMRVHDFLHIGFILYAILGQQPWMRNFDPARYQINPDHFNTAMKLISLRLNDLRRETTALIDKVTAQRTLRLAYLPSALRKFPITTSPDDRFMIATLPELIMFRMTSGLYYDFCAAPQGIINDANNRFEEYARHVLKGFYPELDALPSGRYTVGRNQVDTPDILLKSDNEISIVFECKATKLTYDAQFAEDPINEADKAYNQIIKAVTQLWKFFSHARRGIYNENIISQDAVGVVLTMDAWAQMSGPLQSQIIDRANEIVSRDADIIAADKRQIVFCPIQEIMDILHTSSFNDLKSTLQAATTPQYQGWGLREIRKRLELPEQRRRFPFDVADMLPWWERFQRPNKG